VLDPARAPKRTDLPWLRHRFRPRAVPNGGGIRYEHDRPRRTPSPEPAAAPPSLDLDQPIRYVHDRPRRTASPEPAPAPSGGPEQPPGSASLDLDEPAAPAERIPSSAPAAPARRATVERIGPGQRRILTPDEPTVTLTRLQSGIGTLEFEAAVPSGAGDLRIGALYELADGLSSTVDLAAGRRTAPAPPRSAVLVARRERFEQLAVDLRRCRELRRLVVYGLSASRQPLSWSGTLVVTTFGGGRIDLPLESLRPGATAVLLSLYNVAGEFVLRAEMATVDGTLRDAARAYGYDRITWLDDRTPID
jgi:hypothetical protein